MLTLAECRGSPREHAWAPEPSREGGYAALSFRRAEWRVVPRFMYLVQMDGDDEVWLPSLCARLLELFYDDAADVEAYTQQIGELMLSFPRPCVPLEIAVLHMAKRSVHFALRLYWMLSSTLQDAAQLPPSTSSRTRLAGKTRAGRMLLCLYAVIEERAKGCSGQHDTPHDYLQKIIEDHRGEAPALAAIASALCEVQAAGHGIAVSVPACPASPPSVLHLPSGAAALSGSEGTSVGAASSHTSGSEPDPADADARCALGSVKLLLQQEHERRPSLCNSMSAQQEAPAEAGVESAEMAQRLLEWTAKQNLMHARGSFFSGECLFVEKLVQIAESLRVEQPHLRPARLVVMLTRINALLAAHPVYIPFGTSQQDVRQVVRIPPEHAKVFTTACRTPCWLVLETVATGKPACAADLDHIQRLRRYADTVGFKRRVVRDGLLPDLLQLPASALAAATAVSPSKWLGALSLTRDRKASSMKSPLLEAQPSPKVSSHKRSPEISPLLSARTWAERRVEVLAGGDGGDGEDGGLAAAQGCPGMSPLAKHTSPASAKESARQKSSPHGKEAKGNARFFGDTADATDGAAGQRATLCAGAQRTGSADTHCDREWAAAGSPQAGTEHRDAGACDQSAAAHQGAHAAGLRGDGSGQVAQKEDGLHADAESSRDQSMGEEDVERMGEEEFERVDPELLHSLAALLRSESRVGVSCELASGEGGGQTEQEGSLAPETWAEMVARLKKTSPHGRRRGFRIETVIVKSFDDLRQEAFAMQLICELDAVWKACKVPVKVHCYRILPTSASAGLIEGLPEALSIDAVKKRYRVCTGARADPQKCPAQTMLETACRQRARVCNCVHAFAHACVRARARTGAERSSCWPCAGAWKKGWGHCAATLPRYMAARAQLRSNWRSGISRRAWRGTAWCSMCCSSRTATTVTSCSTRTAT